MTWRDRGRARKRTAEERAKPSNEERRGVRRLLYASVSDPGAGYNAEYHPQHIVNWFLDCYRAIDEPERVQTRNDDVKYIQRPSKIPTFSAYSVETGISQKALLEWRDVHTEFGEAYAFCHAIQEASLVQLGANGAHVPAFASLMAKNLIGWKEKVEAEHVGAVKLVFDADDAEA